MLGFRDDQQIDQEAGRPRAGSAVSICLIPGATGLPSSTLPLPGCYTQDIRYSERVEGSVSLSCGPEISPGVALALVTKEFPCQYRKQHCPAFQDSSLLSTSCLSLALHSSHPYSIPALLFLVQCHTSGHQQ